VCPGFSYEKASRDRLPFWLRGAELVRDSIMFFVATSFFASFLVGTRNEGGQTFRFERKRII
jgi:hypothetical protein